MLPVRDMPKEEIQSSAGTAEVQPPELFPRQALNRLVPWVVLGAMLYAVVIASGDDAGQIKAALAEISAQTIILAVGLSMASFALRFVRWHAYLRLTNIVVPLGDSAVIFLVGFLTSVTPGKVGEVVKSLLLKERYGIAVATSAPIVIAERLTDLAAMLMIGGYGVALAAPQWANVTIIGLAVIAIAMGVALSQKRISSWVFERLLRLKIVRRFREKLVQASASLGRLCSPRAFLAATSVSLLAWGTQAACVPVVAQEFPGGQLSLAQGALAYAGPLLLGTLTLIPGGIGPTEASMAGILVWVRAPDMVLVHAVAITLLVRIITFWLAIALGFLAVVLWRISSKGRPASSG